MENDSMLKSILIKLLLLVFSTLVFTPCYGGYFDVMNESRSRYSCPLPEDISGDKGVYISAKSTDKAQWVGVLVGGQKEEIISFVKAIYIKTRPGLDGSGFVNGCVYKVSSGKYLDMRLDLNDVYKSNMRLELSISWRESQQSSPVILECVDKYKEACAFYIE